MRGRRTPSDEVDEPQVTGLRPSRRAALIGGSGLLAGVGLAGGFAAGQAFADDGTGDHPTIFDLHGTHQPGIAAPVQDRLHFAAFDVTTQSRDELVEMLRQWTKAAERLMHGDSAGPIGPTSGDYRTPPDDTGEAIGLPPSRLTLTFGFGPGLFVDADGVDRFGLADHRPALLEPLPHFPEDALDPERSNGDLCIQACADDPQVAVHAIRNLARIGFGTVSLRWSQLGFGKTSSTTTGEETPRNLFGFKDGTMNITADETSELDEHVWVAPGDDPDAEWLSGGSYLAVRRINMRIETWDRQPLGSQEEFIGRTKGSGAPLSGATEHSQPDFDMAGSTGPVVPEDSHVRLVHPSHNGGARILRRGYNFVDGSTALGDLDAGLFFLAYVRDPARQFIPMQNAMATSDAMMEYLKFTGSALFAIPPGAGADEYIGQTLFR